MYARTVAQMSDSIDDVELGKLAVKPKKPPVGVWIGAAVVVAVMALVISVVVKGGGPADPKTDAKLICQENFIAARLKAPATAKYLDVTVTQLGDVYTVTGSVDSENSFGALIRSTFTCKVKDSGDQWLLQSATVS